MHFRIERLLLYVPVKKNPGPPQLAPIQLILDGKGRLVYYKQFAKGLSVSDFHLLPDGRMCYWLKDKYYFMDSTFAVIDSVKCVNGIMDDGHEMQVLKNGHYLLLGNEYVKMDLSAYKMFKHMGANGSSHAAVKAGVVQELDKNKHVVFEWHAYKHFHFDEVDSAYLDKTDTVDWTHFNALEEDTDGNILVSSKHLNEITKVNKRSGDVIWRLGGKRNQFNFMNDSAMFFQQHDIRRLANGNITLFDNGTNKNTFHCEAAKEYRLNEKAHTATLLWKYIEDSTSFSDGIGNVERLPDGNTLVNYGRIINRDLMFNVLDSLLHKIFEVVFDKALTSYRVYNYAELPFHFNRPSIKAVRKKGQLYLEAAEGFKDYWWSTGEKERSMEVKYPGVFYVMVPLGDGGYCASVPYLVDEFFGICEPLR